jgi:hypothetical protein
MSNEHLQNLIEYIDENKDTLTDGFYNGICQQVKQSYEQLENTSVKVLCRVMFFKSVYLHAHKLEDVEQSLITQIVPRFRNEIINFRNDKFKRVRPRIKRVKEELSRGGMVEYRRGLYQEQRTSHNIYFKAHCEYCEESDSVEESSDIMAECYTAEYITHIHTNEKALIDTTALLNISNPII